MIKAKKFGTFAGVFTPSILTILGVIMYMRLGWVIGQAGLISTIVIIVLAHVISLSTGLSVSSIATDKNIKAGGIYYMLSRSLGLPMGGAIGITLFIGTALSIALYLVGFAENFLSIVEIRTFLGLEQNLDGYRIVGSAAILILFIIAFISTSLAIKTQYYILGAIALSLISIFAGFYFNTSFHPDSINISPLNSEIDMAVVFAVFFPAVTGFTAGVAMSGDLKDPRKSIPMGTMSSIIVGFITYVVLAIGIALFVTRDMLVNDINFLMKVAWIPALVIAGIWGATLSSAMGGILGGPRILQAMSSDRIGPGIFSKVYGVNNEPRIALLVIFVIAEAGILIGELNLIAKVVSMFYLASYGFINIAYYLESWASTDFRPSFKVNRYIGLIGFIAAFGVMFQLDALSMFAALIIMISIYFILKRKQVKLDFGDVWQSVWSSLMRTALEKMDNAVEVERNWQPNIILFSGGTKKRPHLLNLGQCLVGRHGVLSNFDMIENKRAKVLFPKKNQSLPGETSARGVFTRRQTVKDIYAGIDMISRTYGFSGLEPNTVMLGWARQTKNPEKFVELLKTLYDLDLNVLMLGYDKEVGYGTKETIDIWFRDKSNHGNLALTLSKLLIMSDDWQSAKVRVLVVNYRNEKSEIIYRKMESILDHMRISAEIKVINNQIERKPFYEIVKVESAETDLVFLEIPRIRNNEEQIFVDQTNKLLSSIGTVMLIEASSSFKKLKIGSEELQSDEYEKELTSTLAKLKIPEIDFPGKLELKEELKQISLSLSKLVNDYYGRYYHPMLEFRSEKLNQTNKAVDKAFAVLEQRLPDLNKNERIQLISQIKTSLLIKLGKLIDEQFNNIPAEVEESLEAGTLFFLKSLNEIINDIPDSVKIQLDSIDIERNESDDFRTRLFKNNILLFKKKILQSTGIPYELKLKKLCQADLPLKKLETILNTFTEFGNYNITFGFEYHKTLYSLSDSLLVIEKNSESENINKILDESKESVFEHIKRLENISTSIKHKLSSLLLADTNEIINNIGKRIEKVPANHYIASYPKKEIRDVTRKIQTLPGIWADNHKLLLRSIRTESQLLLVEYRLYKIIQEALVEIRRFLDVQVFSEIKEIQSSLDPKKSMDNRKGSATQIMLTLNSKSLQLNLNKIIDKVFRNIKSVIRQLPENIEIFTEDTFNELTNIQFEGVETIKIPVFRIVDYVIQNNLIAPIVSKTNNLVKDVHIAVTKIEDAARLVSLGTSDENSNLIGNSSENFDNVESFIEEQMNRIKTNIETIESEFENYRTGVNLQLNNATADLHLFRLSKAAESNYNITRKEAEKRLQFFTKYIASTKAFIQKQKANIWHSQSTAKLFARKITESESDQPSVIDKLLNFKDSVSAKPSSLEKLPFYYQQLFLSKYNFQAEFWFGRQKELNEGRRAIQRFKSGHKGILVISGEWRSGKSFLANYLVSENLKELPIYHINPQNAGSVNKEDFVKAVAGAIDIQGSLIDIFNNLQENSILIFDDMDLWWEKSENGSDIIGTIYNLISLYSEKYLFILSFSKAVYNIVNQIYPFEHFALQNIQLQPFSSKELQEIILFRHKTSGFNLQVDGTLPGGLTQARQARLFNQIFKFSEGNIGAALLCWIANIKDFKNETIYIKSPKTPDIRVFDLLSKEMKVYLMQFVLHRRLSVPKLARIIKEKEEIVSYNLDYLKRSGLIMEQAGSIFELDSYIYKLLMEYMFNEFDTKG